MNVKAKKALYEFAVGIIGGLVILIPVYLIVLLEL